MPELSNTEALQLLNSSEAASLLGVNSVIMETWRRQGRGPKYIRINQRTVRYRLGDLAAFQDAHIVECVA